MQLSVPVAHAICLALVAADLVARTYRLQWLALGVGSRLTFAESLRINAFADAGSTLTPMRVGGEPARLGGMLACGIPATASFVAIAYEVITAWPVLIAVGLWIFLGFAPEWWASAGPQLTASLRDAWPWAVAIAVVSLAAWIGGHRVAHALPRQLKRPLSRIRVYWRRMPRWPLIASLPLSFVNVITRIALLPVLALTLPDPPALPVLIVGSFALIYAQLILPTPGGAGAVEFGFLGGAAGDLGTDGSQLLLAWRIYANGIGAALGIWLAIRHYGWPAVKEGAARIFIGRGG
ncbi:MAG: Lysylphosphatidylglycerol synthase region [Gemmatimonadetes bacterium]|jgi:uncharacterized membrane protein YbhN (UPF0104 family)|nr:Lysylphosphatidylglycerol synthase region [Gemmatimonadota bacterium]